MVQDSALGSYSYSASRYSYSYSIRSSATVRWTRRVSIDTIRFKSDFPSNLEEPVLVFEALLAVPFGDIQRNRLCSTQPLVASRSIDAGKRLGEAIRERNVVERVAINIEAFMIESWFCHHDPFEYEYEYRCPEYEYDCPDERVLDRRRERTSPHRAPDRRGDPAQSRNLRRHARHWPT